MSSDKLGLFLREVSNWNWEQFVKAEHDTSYTSNQAMIFALIRSCAMQKMDAIRMSLNRLDGKLKTPIKIEYPKIYYLFPNAKKLENQKEASSVRPLIDHEESIVREVSRPTEIIPREPELEPDLPSMSLRQTLTKMADYPRELPQGVVALAQQVDQALNDQGPMPAEIPIVKSVVAAHLLILAQNRDVGALSEVFDQIDGKLAETLQIIGEDIFITSYASVAPEGASLNEDGVLQIEATRAQDLWANKLGRQMTDG